MLDEPPVEGNEVPQQNGIIPKVYVIDGLLDLTLSVSSLPAFDSRMAACECIKAYFFNHAAIRKHFLRRAIDGHASGADETANVLTTVLQPLDGHIQEILTDIGLQLSSFSISFSKIQLPRISR